MKDGCEKAVCERCCVEDGWRVTEMCDKVVCERRCVTKLCVRDGEEGAEEEEEAAEVLDTETKIRTPHKDVGKKKNDRLKMRLALAKHKWGLSDNRVPPKTGVHHRIPH